MDQRATERFVVDLELEGTLEARNLRVIVYDLSMDGCMVETQGTPLPEPGQAIQLTFPHGLVVSGKLAWTASLNAGVQFANRLDQAVVADLSFKPPHQVDHFSDRFGRKVSLGRSR